MAVAVDRRRLPPRVIRLVERNESRDVCSCARRWNSRPLERLVNAALGVGGEGQARSRSTPRRQLDQNAGEKRPRRRSRSRPRKPTPKSCWQECSRFMVKDCDAKEPLVNGFWRGNYPTRSGVK